MGCFKAIFCQLLHLVPFVIAPVALPLMTPYSFLFPLQAMHTTWPSEAVWRNTIGTTLERFFRTKASAASWQTTQRTWGWSASRDPRGGEREGWGGRASWFIYPGEWGTKEGQRAVAREGERGGERRFGIKTGCDSHRGHKQWGNWKDELFDR